MIGAGFSQIGQNFGLFCFWIGFGGRFRLHGTAAAHAAINSADEVAAERGLPRLRVVADILRVEIMVRSGLIESAATKITASTRGNQSASNQANTSASGREAQILLISAATRNGAARPDCAASFLQAEYMLPPGLGSSPWAASKAASHRAVLHESNHGRDTQHPRHFS